MVDRLLGQFTYLAIFGLLVGGGVGLPFPEELTQLGAGFLARSGRVSFGPALATAWTGILIGDWLLFRLGRRHGPRVLSLPAVARVLTPRRRRLLESHFARHAFLTIAVGRHASGLRFPTFALAGASGVPTRTFLLADGLSALVSVPLVMGLGWFFASRLEEVKADLRKAELGLAALVLAVALAITLCPRRRPPGPAGPA